MDGLPFLHNVQTSLMIRLKHLTQRYLIKHHLIASCFRDLDAVADNEITSCALLYIDTAGCDLPELDLPDEVSRGNEGWPACV